MKKIFTLFVALILAGCSALPPELMAQFYTPTPLPPTREVTATTTPSITPTRPTPTFTFTPTLIGQKPTPTETGAASTMDLTATLDVPLLKDVTETSAPAGPLPSIEQLGGFASALISERQIYYGACDLPRETIITATVQNPKDITSVLAFFRFVNKKTGGYTAWSPAMAMQNRGGGTFTMTLNATDLPNYSQFSDVWIAYQLVSVNKNGNPVGRTSIINESITLLACP